MSQKTLNLCLERYNFVKFGETTKSTHTVLCTNNAYSVNSDNYRLTPTAIASKHGEGYVFTLNYDFDRPLFTIVQKSYTLDGTSGNIIFEGIDPIAKGDSKYLRKVTVSPVKLSDGSYLLEVTGDEYLRIGTTGAALGDEELESLNEKIVTDGGITKSVETVGGKQVLKLDASGSTGANEIVYFDVDPSDPPSGIYEDIGEALANDKEPVIKIDGDVYFYTSTGTDKYIFVGGYDTDVVNYTTVTVSDDDSVVKETVDTIEGMVFPLYYHSNDGGFTVADKTGHALTKTEIADAYRAGQIFMFSSYPASNTQAHWGYCCDINIESNNTGYAEFLILDAFGGDVYSWEKYRINLSSGTEFVTLWGPNTSYSTGYSGYYADGATTVSVSGSQDFSATQKAQGRDNIGAASASDVTALQSQVSSLSDVSAYSVKGEATVAQLNAGPSGIQAGWAYQLTDSGTLTDGSLAVVAGDTVAWDGTKWFPLVKSDYYATKTYAQNVAHSITPPFDPTRDSEHAYKAGESVMYIDGKSYMFKVDHYGPWSAADVDRISISELLATKIQTSDGYCSASSTYDETKPGYYATTSGYSQSALYDTFIFEAKHDGSIYPITFSVTYFSITIFDNASQNSGVQYLKLSGGENTLPTEDNPASFVKGNYIAITTRTGIDFSCKLLGYVVSKLLDENVVFNQSQLDQIVALQKDKVVCQFINGSGDGNSTQRFEVCVPAKVGYVKYQFVHSVSVAKNSDCWRIQSAVAVDDDFVYRFDLTKLGEWECAIRLVGRDDFSGGISHGNEVLVDASFWADGEKLDLQTLTSTPFVCSKFRIATSSHLYDKADGTTNFADHGCEHIFSKDGCEIVQSVKFIVESDIMTAYLAMGVPSANITDHYIVDSDINGGVAAPDSQKIIKQDLQKIFIYGDSSGVAFTLELLKNYPFLHNPYRGLLTHTTANHIYFVIRYNESYHVAVDELWLTRHRINFEVGK